MTSAFKSIEKGLNEAIEHARGARVLQTHQVEVPEDNISHIRKRRQETQARGAKNAPTAIVEAGLRRVATR